MNDSCSSRTERPTGTCDSEKQKKPQNNQKKVKAEEETQGQPVQGGQEGEPAAAVQDSRLPITAESGCEADTHHPSSHLAKALALLPAQSHHHSQSGWTRCHYKVRRVHGRLYYSCKNLVGDLRLTLKELRPNLIFSPIFSCIGGKTERR